MSSAEQQLIDDIGSFACDPLGFVLYAFPWGEPGPLKEYDGPDEWQRVILTDLGNGLIDVAQAVQLAVASGHGIGKSALVAWIILWAMSTMPNTKGVVTANTETQLRTKTWAELAKWKTMCICEHWFELTATALTAKNPKYTKTWRIDQVPWSERNTEAFAGLHNKGRRVLLVFDEASSIPDVIWEVSEGALTDESTEIIWAAFGNPTRNTGRFRECFGRLAHRWTTKRVDSRTARMTNKKQIQQWVDDYGEDSDFVRVRVKGEFPRAGSTQFIGSDLVASARKYESVGHESMPVILGVDVARFGDDQSVIFKRQGRKAEKLATYRGLDTVQMAERVAEFIRDIKPDAVVVDGDGIGAGVVDQLNARNYHVHEFHGGAEPWDKQKYFNRRAEIWGMMRDWLKSGAQVPDDPELEQDVCGPDYMFSPSGQIKLERKEDMKKRGLASPDLADALAMTFSVSPNSLMREDEPEDEYETLGGSLDAWMR